MRRYIEMKRLLGRKFDGPERLLASLDRFLCTLQPPDRDLTAKTFWQWSETLESLSANTRRSRMCALRNFCLYRRRSSPDCFVPDRSQFPLPQARMKAYVYTEEEVAQLLDKAPALDQGSLHSRRGVSTRLAILLLYTTGIRRGELLNLRCGDYNSEQKTLRIRPSKFSKSRLLPLPPDLAEEVEHHLHTVKRWEGLVGTETPLMMSPYGAGHAYSGTQLRKNINHLLQLCQIRKRDGRLPRIHDFRHSFAINAWLRWYRAGVEVRSKLPFLAAYMGHLSIFSTHYYLQFIEPLTSQASQLFEREWGTVLSVEPEGTR
jgi:integrase